MKQNKKIKDNKNALIFGYDNFVTKSSQQRYYELKTEVKNKLDKISDDVNIAGSNEKEKKYNLLIHYKQLFEGLEFSKEEEKDNFQILSSFIMVTAMFMVAWFPFALSFLEKDNDNSMVIYMFSVIALLIILTGFTFIFAYFKSGQKKNVEEGKQKYLYYKFYYYEIKKYVNEEEMV